MQKYDIKWICESADIRYNRCVEFNKSEFVEESNLLVLNKLERLLTVCFSPKENYTRSELLKVNEK